MIGLRDSTLGRGWPSGLRLMTLVIGRLFVPPRPSFLANTAELNQEDSVMARNGVAPLFNWITPYEIGLCLYLNRGCRIKWWRNFWVMVSRLGDGFLWYALLLLLPLLYGIAGMVASIQMMAVGCVCLMVYRLLKQRTGRTRPFHANHRITMGTLPLDTYSFPSGHTLHAVGFSLVAIHHLPLLFWLLLPVVALIAISRIVLGLHYPTDVLCGVLLGLIIAFGSFLVFPQFLNFFPYGWSYENFDVF